MDIRAPVAREPGKPLEIMTLQLSDLRPDEVRVRMVGAGVCHSAMLARDQQYPVPLPVIPGDEGAGIVEEVGAAVTDLAAGDHVVLGYNSCGQCALCRGGHPGNCVDFFAHNFGGYRPDGTSAVSLDGAPVAAWFFGQSSFASHMNVQARLAVKIPTTLPLPLFAPVGCGISTGAGAVLNVLDPQPGDSFAVFGTGGVGFAGLLAAKAAGCATVIAIDVSPQRLSLATDLGATHTVNAADTDVVEAVRAATGGRGVDHALDAVGVSAVFTQMTESLATRGHGVLVGAPAPGDTAQVDVGRLLFTGQRLTMVIEGDAVPREFIPRMVRLYDAGWLPLDRLVTTYPLDEVNTAMDDAEYGTAIKPVLTFD